MGHICEAPSTGLVENILPQSWLILISHILKAEVEICLLFSLICLVQLNVHVILRKAAAGDWLPQIVALIDQFEPDGLFFCRQESDKCITESVLTQRHRPRRIFLPAWLGAFLAWNTHHRVDVAVVRQVNVLLNWVAELLNEPDRR